MVVDNYIEVNLGKGVSDARKILTEEIVRWCIRQLLPKVRTLDITVDLLNELMVVLMGINGLVMIIVNILLR